MKKIMIAIDGSPLSEKTAQKGYELAKSIGAVAGMAYVVNPEEVVGESGYTANEWISKCKQEGQDVLERIKKELEDKDIWTFVEVGSPARTILRIASEWGADIIVVGTHGRKGVSHLLMGSVAEHIVRHSNVPVLVIPAKNS